MNKYQILTFIDITLKEVDLHSLSAVNLLMGTGAQETHLGEYLRQFPNGPALGFFQMEPLTFEDILANSVTFQRNEQRIRAACNIQYLTPTSLMYNLKVAVIFCRLRYTMFQEPLPAHNDIAGMARYWKRYYNTAAGKGTEAEFIENYKRYVL